MSLRHLVTTFLARAKWNLNICSKNYSFYKNPEYSFKTNIHFSKIQNIYSKKIIHFSKIPKNINFFKRGYIGQGYQDVICCGDDVGHESYLIFNSIKYKWVGGRQHCERQGQHGGDEDQGGRWYYQYVSLQLNFLLSYDKLWLWWLKSKLLSSIF